MMLDKGEQNEGMGQKLNENRLAPLLQELNLTAAQC